MATQIYAMNVACSDAREVVWAVRKGTVSPQGFSCGSAVYPQGRSGQGMAETVYECRRGTAVIRWSVT